MELFIAKDFETPDASNMSLVCRNQRYFWLLLLRFFWRCDSNPKLFLSRKIHSRFRSLRCCSAVGQVHGLFLHGQKHTLQEYLTLVFLLDQKCLLMLCKLHLEVGVFSMGEGPCVQDLSPIASERAKQTRVPLASISLNHNEHSCVNLATS